MLKLNLAMGAVVAAMIAGPALAQDNSATGFYGSLGYTGFNATGASSTDLGAITGRLGTRINRWFGVEGEVSGGVDDGHGRVGQSVHLDHQYAGYAVGYLPVLPRLDLLARLGYGETKLDTGFGSRSGESVNYGAGAQYAVTAKDAVRFDYTRYDREDRSIPSSNAWTLSYVRRF